MPTRKFLIKRKQWCIAQLKTSRLTELNNVDAARELNKIAYYECKAYNVCGQYVSNLRNRFDLPSPKTKKPLNDDAWEKPRMIKSKVSASDRLKQMIDDGVGQNTFIIDKKV